MNNFIFNREAFRKSLDLDDFVEEARQIVKDYKCPLCEGIYLNPVVDNCGHVYCKGCINTFLETFDKCPFSGWKLEEKSVSKLLIIGDILERQTVLCKNRHFHCEWSGKLIELGPHLNNDCRRQIVKCPHSGCENSVFREDLNDHTSACEWRIVACLDCHILTPYIEVKSHQEVCPRFKVPCPQKCESFIERQDNDSHIQDVCLNTVIACPYKEIGCFSRVTKRELCDYMTVNSNRHNLMLISHFKGFTNEIMNRSLNFSNSHFSGLEERVRSLETQILLLSSQVKEMEKTISLGKLEEGSPRRERSVSRVILKNRNSVEEEKFMSRKRPRPDEENPLNIEKSETVINLNEIPSLENTGTSLNKICHSPFQVDTSPVSPQFMVNNNFISNEKEEATFDTVNISKGLLITNNKVALNSTGKLEHKYVFANVDLEKDREWKVTLSITSNWAAVGVCLKELVIANKYKFITNNPNFSNATFAISTNGYSWNCNVPAEHNTNIPNFSSPILKGDVVTFKYSAEEKELTYAIGNKLSGKLTSVNPSKGFNLVPCLIFLHMGDEMLFELN